MLLCGSNGRFRGPPHTFRSQGNFKSPEAGILTQGFTSAPSQHWPPSFLLLFINPLEACLFVLVLVMQISVCVRGTALELLDAITWLFEGSLWAWAGCFCTSFLIGICFVLWTISTFVMEGAQQWPIGLLPSSSLQFLFFGLSPLIIHKSPSLEVLGIIQEAESQEDNTTKQNVKDKNLTRFGSFCGGASLSMQLWWGYA